MERASTDSVRSLLDGAAGTRVSIFLPVPERPGFDDVRSHRASYVALVRACEKKMDELGVDGSEIRAYAQDLELVDVDLEALPPATGSVAVLHGPSGTRTFSLTVGVEPSFHVGRTFRIRPLLESSQREHRYRVLSLTTNRVELFEGDTRSLWRVHEDFPSSLREALGAELTERSLQWHSSAAGGAAPVFHGHGGADRGRSVDKERFHHVLAGSLREVWSAGEPPIVLVADRAHEGRFRKVADLPGLLPEGVVGNPHGWPQEELHRRVLSVVSDRSERQEDECLERASAALAHGRALDDLAPAASAAVAGGVAGILVSRGQRVSAHIEPADGTLLDPFGDEDALDELCGLVLSRGGTALVLDGERLRTATGFLAELRG